MQKFSKFTYNRPDLDAIAIRFRDVLDNFKNADSALAQREALVALYEVRQEWESMSDLASVRYTLDTRDPFYKAEKQFFNEQAPRYQGLITEQYRALLEARFREELELQLGSQLFALAEANIRTYKPEIDGLLQRENELTMAYVELTSGAQIEFEGETYNLSQIGKFMSQPDRDLRRRASAARWGFMAENQAELDRIFDELVKTRHEIARELGYENFVSLAYDRLNRTDYGPEEVAVFRAAVAEHLVPWVTQLRESQRQRLGLDELRFYDEAIRFPEGNPKPQGDPEWIVAQGAKLYRSLSPETAEWYDFMRERELMDLTARPGKAPGGYCTYIENFEAPFIFANFNGTEDDIFVLTHEAGHAFQVYRSRGQAVTEYGWPTLEACEIHSMSMEMFTRPQMELFFGEDADRYRSGHLLSALFFLPYGVAVDEFQHRIYEQADLSPARRRSLWREIERRYVPHRNYAGTDYLENGGFWQIQRHIYQAPFYYIDYVLAQVCAFQFWMRARTEGETAWLDYVRLCGVGGSKSFLDLVQYAGLESPFERATLARVVRYLERAVGEEATV